MHLVGESRNELARDKHEANVTPMNLNDGMGAVVNSELATQQDEMISFSSTWDEDEIGKVEPGSSNESVTNEEDETGKVEPGPSNESVKNETHANFLKDINGEVGDFVTTCFPEVVMARDKQEAHVTPMNLNDGMGTIVNGQLATQQDKVITFSSICCEDENGEVEPVSSREPVTNETHANLFNDVTGEKGVSVSTSFPEDAMPRVSEIKDSSGRSGNSESEPSVPVMVRKVFNERPSKSVHLSNGERLLLRKQALKMKTRPVLAVGRNNIASGVAKTIKAHFEKHPLAIVNVKGRAKGTSVREVVLKLEQAAGGVLVSQEPSKVILYRGWGAAGDHDRKSSNMGKKVSTQGAVS